jgi:hypothetical protein
MHTISAAIQFTETPKPLNRPCTITRSPSATIVPGSYFDVGGKLLMRLKKTLATGCDVGAVLNGVRRPESFDDRIIALVELKSVSNASKTRALFCSGIVGIPIPFSHLELGTNS